MNIKFSNLGVAMFMFCAGFSLASQLELGPRLSISIILFLCGALCLYCGGEGDL